MIKNFDVIIPAFLGSLIMIIAVLKLVAVNEEVNAGWAWMFIGMGAGGIMLIIVAAYKAMRT